MFIYIYLCTIYIFIYLYIYIYEYIYIYMYIYICKCISTRIISLTLIYDDLQNYIDALGPMWADTCDADAVETANGVCAYMYTFI